MRCAVSLRRLASVFNKLMAALLLVLLAGWYMGLWDIAAALAWLHERFAEAWQTLGAFGKGLLQYFYLRPCVERPLSPPKRTYLSAARDGRF